ncbi:ATP-binding protein [Lacisediminihabitans sp.]|uniref:ATP-binding protein n=1 Tax=Lacisediminihabitans sp. TaxID=2787631 RepID=UPI00374DCBD8
MRQHSNAVAIVRALPSPARLGIIGAALIATYLLGVSAVFLTPAGSTTAAWWPAAGAAVLAVLFARRARWAVAVLIFLIGVASNFSAGRPILVSVGFGVANAGEAWIVGALLSGGRPDPGLRTMKDVGRLLIAATLGALAIGALAALVVLVADGGDFVSTMAAVTASHASAVIVIVPTALAAFGGPRSGRRIEQAAQILIAAAVVGFVFSLSNSLPLAFLTLPVLSWAAFRFSYGFVVAELFFTALIASVLTSLGGGPFVGAEFFGASVTNEMLQIFIVAQAGSVLFYGAGRLERERLARQVVAREQLLRGGLVGAQVGLLILEPRVFPEARIVLGNLAAAELLGWPELEGIGEAGVATKILDLTRPDPVIRILAKHFAGDGSAETGEVTTPTGRRVQFFLGTLGPDSDGAILTAQFVDITERHALEVANEKALLREQQLVDQLRDLNRQKDDFVSSVSHELRTPITSMLGFAEELEDSVVDPTQLGYVQVILRNARRLADLVEDLLELGSMTSRMPVRDAVLVDANAVILECVVEQSTTARDRGIEVSTSLSTESPWVRSASHDLARIVSNILSNAIKFSLAQGSVSVSTACEAHEVRITITDRGPGIPPDDLERVFERFYRSPAEALRVIPGTGLGLPIVKSLVERHGGRLTLESDHARGGTTVCVIFPTEPTPAVSPSAR